MALDKVVDSAELDAGLTMIGDAIRKKSFGYEKLPFPEGLAAGIEVVYETGHAAGEEKGYDAGYEEGYNKAITDQTLVMQSVLDKTIVDLYSESTTSIKAHTMRECYNLKTVSFPNLTGEINGYAFYNCTALESIYFPNAETFVGTQAFGYCTSLQYASFPKIGYINGDPFLNSGVEVVDFGNIQVIFAKPFQGCSAFKALALRLSGLCTLSQSDAFDGTNIEAGTAYIYVPASLVDSYKAATNWSTYASQIRALEDYTVDGTVSGELDLTKIAA